MGSTTKTDRFRALAGAEMSRQGLRFVITGGLVALVYVSITTILAELVGLPFETSLAIGFIVAICTHFSMQRLFVWRHPGEFALPLHHQLARYLVLAALQYGVTAAITATLPRPLGVSPEIVYLPTVGALSAINFLVLRSRIFHPAIGL
jgi:putative flippase GtrA